MFSSELMDISELSGMLGYCSATLRNALKAGSIDIAYYQEGPYQQYFFRKCEVIEFIKRTKR